MRAHLAYISEGRAWPSTVISTNASMAMLSTAQKVKALNQETAGHKVMWPMVLVYYLYTIVMLNKADSFFYG